MSSNDVKSTAIVVLGMHRSGTSAAAGVLSLLGVQLGSRLDPPHEYDNPKGYFENSRIVEFNRRVLRNQSSRWDDVVAAVDGWERSPQLTPLIEQASRLLREEFDGVPLWAIKDPRLCRLLPFWLRVFENLGVRFRYLLTIRHPMEVAASLGLRDGHSPAKALRLWLLHCLESERRTRDERRSFLFYEDLLAASRREMSRIGSELEIEWPTERWSEVDGFLSESLRRHADRSSAPDCLATRVYDLLRSKPPVDSSSLERYWAEFCESEASREVRDHVRQITGELHAARSQLERMEASLSWRLTAPLRALKSKSGPDDAPES